MVRASEINKRDIYIYIYDLLETNFIIFTLFIQLYCSIVRSPMYNPSSTSYSSSFPNLFTFQIHTDEHAFEWRFEKLARTRRDRDNRASAFPTRTPRACLFFLPRLSARLASGSDSRVKNKKKKSNVQHGVRTLGKALARTRSFHIRESNFNDKQVFTRLYTRAFLRCSKKKKFRKMTRIYILCCAFTNMRACGNPFSKRRSVIYKYIIHRFEILFERRNGRKLRCSSSFLLLYFCSLRFGNGLDQTQLYYML